MSKETKSSKIDFTKLIDALAKAIAYVSLVMLASYGLRQLLKTLNDTCSVALTVLVVFGLVYIIFKKQ